MGVEALYARAPSRRSGCVLLLRAASGATDVMNLHIVPGLDVERFRSELMQVVTVHQAMFQKLLFEHPALPLELAELFEDAGNVYLGFSEAISAQHLTSRRPAGPAVLDGIAAYGARG
jgi:hypothetical protein